MHLFQPTRREKRRCEEVKMRGNVCSAGRQASQTRVEAQVRGVAYHLAGAGRQRAAVVYL